MAAYFTYTPAAVAAWNPGWLVHYLNLEHTPSKAAGFAAAAAIFHREKSPEMHMETERWHGDGYVIERKNDRVVYADHEFFCYSNDTDVVPPNLNSLNKIFGRGKSSVASCSGNGCYVLEKKSDDLWTLHLHPAQRFLADPQRGRQFKTMANRWISCLKEPPVSQLREDMLDFSFFLSPLQKVTSLSMQEDFPLKDNHSACLPPGDYLLTLDIEK